MARLAAISITGAAATPAAPPRLSARPTGAAVCARARFSIARITRPAFRSGCAARSIRRSRWLRPLWASLRLRSATSCASAVTQTARGWARRRLGAGPGTIPNRCGSTAAISVDPRGGAGHGCFGSASAPAFVPGMTPRYSQYLLVKIMQADARAGVGGAE